MKPTNESERRQRILEDIRLSLGALPAFLTKTEIIQTGILAEPSFERAMRQDKNLFRQNKAGRYNLSDLVDYALMRADRQLSPQKLKAVLANLEKANRVRLTKAPQTVTA